MKRSTSSRRCASATPCSAACPQRIRKVQAAMAAASEPDASDEDELDAAFDDLLSDD
jgi:CO dehydrogenase/acetyl-CoA synthase alpha subunit